MERLTQRSKAGKYYVVTGSVAELTGEGLRGDAIERLASYENFYDALMAKYQSIPAEMEKLRKEGKTSTLRFKELLGHKINYSSILALLYENGLQ